MKAIVLAAGYGTRMGNLTQEIPKPMLDVNGYPILAYIIHNLVKYKFDEIVINLHFRPNVIREYFGNGSSWGARLTYSYEPDLLGTAGGVKNVESFLCNEEAFLIHYGDVLTNQNFTDMANFHMQHKALATLLIHQRSNSNSSVTLDEANRITGFLERPTADQRQGVTTPWVNSGIYICNPEIFNYISGGNYLDMPRHVFIPQIGNGRFFGFPLSGFRYSIDSPYRLEDARRSLIGKLSVLPISTE